MGILRTYGFALREERRYMGEHLHSLQVKGEAQGHNFQPGPQRNSAKPPVAPLTSTTPTFCPEKLREQNHAAAWAFFEAGPPPPPREGGPARDHAASQPAAPNPAWDLSPPREGGSPSHFRGHEKRHEQFSFVPEA